MEQNLVIGIDVGGQTTKCGVVDARGTVLAQTVIRSDSYTTVEPYIEELAAALKKIITDAGAEGQIRGIGVGAPNANYYTGEVENAVNLSWGRAGSIPFAKMLTEAMGGIPVTLTNDANAAAYGELLAGAGKGCKDFVAVTLGTGVGSGIILDGKILTGSNFAGGEIGHSYIIAGGEKCSCGNCGCWEAYASASALKRQTAEAMKAHPESVMWKIAGSLEGVDGRTAFDAMRKNDEAGKEVVDNYIRYVSIGIVNVINIFQPEFVCIGGGICNEKETLLAPIREFVDAHDYNRNPKVRTKICTAILGNDAGIIGAAGLFKLA